MKLTYRQKLYFSILIIFLLFFNGGIFSVAAIQNANAFSARQKNYLTQNNMVLQQIISDMETVYSTRPQSIPLIIRQHATRQSANGISLQFTTNNNEYIYSSFSQEMEFIATSPEKIKYRTETIDGQKIFCVYTVLPQPFDNYFAVTGYSVQLLFNEWNTTVKGLMVLSLVFSSVIALVLNFFIGKLTKPLIDISSAAEKFGRGDYSVRIQDYSRDELGRTAKNFNEMADKITTQLTTLETLAKDKQRLIDDVSHEMRTPLTAIRGYVAYMQSAKLDEKEYYETLSVIDRQAERMAKLSEGVLAFTNLRRGEVDRITRVNLYSLLSEIHRSYYFKAQNHSISLQFTCYKSIVIYGDKMLFESLIGNIVDNGINACIDSAGKSVTIKGYTTKEGKTVVEIADTGIGMDKETLANIHKPFYRADKSRSRKRGGAGLGGALCKEIADLYHIDISYTSQPGKGTKAKLTF